MEDDGPPGQSIPDLDLTERFFARARAAHLDSKKGFSFSADDLLTIIRNAALRSDFERRFHQEINDAELKRVILRFLEEAAIGMEEAEAASVDRVDLVDRAALGVSIPITVAAVGAIVATAASLGSLVALGGGLIGIALAGTTRYRLRRSAREREFAAKRIRRLLENLGKEGGGSAAS